MWLKKFNLFLICFLVLNLSFYNNQQFVDGHEQQFRQCETNYRENAIHDLYIKGCLSIVDDQLRLKLSFWRKLDSISPSFSSVEFFTTSTYEFQKDSSQTFNESISSEKGALSKSELRVGYSNAIPIDIPLLNQSFDQFSYFKAQTVFTFLVMVDKNIIYSGIINLEIATGSFLIPLVPSEMDQLVDSITVGLMNFLPLLLLLVLLVGFSIIFLMFREKFAIIQRRLYRRIIENEEEINILNLRDIKREYSFIKKINFLLTISYFGVGVIVLGITLDVIQYLGILFILFIVFTIIEFSIFLTNKFVIAVMRQESFISFAQKFELNIDKHISSDFRLEFVIPYDYHLSLSLEKKKKRLTNTIQRQMTRLHFLLYHRRLNKIFSSFDKEKKACGYPQEYLHKKYNNYVIIENNIKNLERIQHNLRKSLSEIIDQQSEFKKAIHNIPTITYLKENFFSQYNKYFIKNSYPDITLPVNSVSILRQLYESIDNKHNKNEFVRRLLTKTQYSFEQTIQTIYNFITNTRHRNSQEQRQLSSLEIDQIKDQLEKYSHTFRKEMRIKNQLDAIQGNIADYKKILSKINYRPIKIDSKINEYHQFINGWYKDLTSQIKWINDTGSDKTRPFIIQRIVIYREKKFLGAILQKGEGS